MILTEKSMLTSQLIKKGELNSRTLAKYERFNILLTL